ncbi:hypothetical protein NDU88_010955 [Pleurodeles waltl]|uniref:Uncharacterized protein n=1 Tax=Pleurodeles waltl TaxID=8319 RepID=A0AAV7Q1P3_PLEWA|nr:hypothetical protein NDU88_010955 [Pleurodeles waltl]
MPRAFPKRCLSHGPIITGGRKITGRPVGALHACFEEQNASSQHVLMDACPTPRPPPPPSQPQARDTQPHAANRRGRRAETGENLSIYIVRALRSRASEAASAASPLFLSSRSARAASVLFTWPFRVCFTLKASVYHLHVPWYPYEQLRITGFLWLQFMKTDYTLAHAYVGVFIDWAIPA